VSDLSEQPTLDERARISLKLSLWFVVVYTATNYLTGLHPDVRSAAFAWETRIPFLPWFIIPYWSIDLFFVCAPFLVSTGSELQVFSKRIFFAISLAGLFFLLFPLRLAFERPAVSGFLGVLFGSLDNLYNFHNLAPSLHIALRSILWTVYVPRFRGVSRLLFEIWFVLIGLSTLFCWQHQVIDVFTGQLLGLSLIHLVRERETYPEVDLARGINCNWSVACKYFAGSVFFIFLASLLPLWGIVFLWPACSLFVVSLAYFGSGGGIYRKQNGSLPVGSRIFFAPFHFGLWLSFKYFTAQKVPYGEIVSGLIMGRALRGSEIAELKRRGVTSMLDLTAEWSEPQEGRELPYRNVPLLDLCLPSKAQLEEAVNAMSAWSGKGSVYVHCSLGLSRAGVVVLYYLVRSGRYRSLAEALEQLRSHRPEVLLNSRKIAYLDEMLRS